MRDFIGLISNTLIDEVKASPRMLEVLADMEQYMSESYDGRTFAELIQKALLFSDYSGREGLLAMCEEIIGALR